MSSGTAESSATRIMIVVLMCFLCFSSTALGQDEDEYSSRIRISTKPVEPFLKLYAEWDPYPNIGADKYEVSICEKRNSCSTYSVERSRTDFTFTSVRYLKLAFWSEYLVNVRVVGKETSKLWAQRKVSTGPGFLPSVQGLQVRGGQKSITVDWAAFSKNMQSVIDFYEIVICHKRVNICSPAEKALSSATEHTFYGLTAGVQYKITVTLHKTFGGHEYMSLPVSVTGFTKPPSRKLYPGVRNVQVELQPKEFDCFFVISYDPPVVPTGKKFYGVLIEIFDYRGQRMIVSTKTQSEKPVVKGLPFFSRFEVRVHALYEEGDDLIETDSVKVAKSTGVGGIAKPEIVKLMAVNGSTAVVRWIHECSDHSEYSYRLTFNDGPTTEVRDMKNEFAFVQDLEPDRQYAVTVTAFQKVDSKEYANTSDEKLLKMLPKNALIPEISVDEIVGDQLLLNCNVTVPPEEEDACSFEVSACLVSSGLCSNTTFESESDPMWISVVPFTNYDIILHTKCVFFDLLTFNAQSEPLQVFTKIRLASVAHIDTFPRDTGLAIEWSVIPSQESFYDGFKLRWSPVGSELGPESDVKEYGFEIGNLQPATEYNISIVGYKCYENETLLGDSAFTTAFTGIPAPPEVEELVVAQVPYSSTIKVTWKAPEYSYAPLEYEIDSKCRSEKSSSTNGVSFEFNFEDLRGGETRCTVGVTSKARNRDNKLVGTNTAWKTISVNLMPTAQDCSVVFVEGQKYQATITAPPELRDLDVLEYRISDSLDRDGGRTRNNSIMIELPNHGGIETRRAQLCANDICGADFICKVETNTGKPGSVNHLHVMLLNVTTLHVTWSKPSLTKGPINGYRVGIQEDSTGEVKSFERKASETYFDYHSGEEYTKFTVTVRAFNLDKFVATADPLVGPKQYLSVETLGTAPRAPEKLEVAYISGKQTLTWKAKFDPTFVVKSYKIVAHDKSAQNRSEISSTSPQLLLSRLKPFTEYSIEVSSCLAESSKQCGKPTKYELTTEVGYPSNPSVAMVERNATAILVRWSTPSIKAGPISGYELAYIESSTGLSPNNWIDVGGESQFAALHDLQPFTEYTVHVRAFNEDHFGAKLRSPVGILIVGTQGVSKGLAAPWIAVLCCLAVGTLLGLGFVALKKLKPDFNVDLQSLIPRGARSEPQTETPNQNPWADTST